jgi:L-cysteine desulfidase
LQEPLSFKEVKIVVESLLTILKNEVKPALGCTGPTSVSFATSVARAAVGGEVESVKVVMDRDTYKNSIAVGIPGTNHMGLDIAASLGAVAGDADAGLEVLHNVTVEDEKRAMSLLPQTRISIDWNRKEVGLYIDATVKTTNGTGQATVVKTHTNVVLIRANEEIVLEKPQEQISASDYSKDAILSYSLEDLFNFSMNEPLENISFLQSAIEMNEVLAKAGFEEQAGGRFGHGLLGCPYQSPLMKAKALTAAASDARMAGLSFPAMSCATSGNVGITASLPLVVMARELGKGNETLLRSLALSFLVTIYLKSHIGRLSPMCACAIAAGLGVASGMVVELGGSFEQVEKAVNTVVGSIGGILCDGAKFGCAMKLANAVGTAIESAYLAMDHIAIRPGDGLVCEKADDTIAILGRIAQKGMAPADEEMCRAIIEREQGF